MKTFLIAAAIILAAVSARAQSTPGFTTLFVPTASQWNGYFGGKVDTTNGVVNGLVDGGALSVAGLVTANGGITGTQTASGTALSAIMSLSRTENADPPGAGDTSLFSSIYTANFADGGFLGYNTMSLTTNVAGSGGVGPTGNFETFGATLNENSLRSLSSPGAGSQTPNIYSIVTKTIPGGGVPAGRSMRDDWNWWSQLLTANLPSSQGGADIISEHDYSVNGLDDTDRRALEQSIFNLRVSLGSGGYPASINAGRVLDATDSSVWFHDAYVMAGNFSHSALNLRYMSSGESTITSATPGSSVWSVTVDNIMPLESGGSAGGGALFPAVSTAIQTYTAAGAASGALVTLTSIGHLADLTDAGAGRFIFDITHPTAIPLETRISSIAGSVLTLSASTTISSGDVLGVSHGADTVTINGDAYYVLGVALSGTGTTAGTVYFGQAVSVADATNGVKIVPPAHVIWLHDAGASAPWNTIAFNDSGSATLGGDGSGGVAITGAGLTATTTGSIGINSVLAGNIYGSSDTRPNGAQTTLALSSGATSNIWENSFNSVTLSGSGALGGEVNVSHSYFENDDSGALTSSVEGFESSALNNGNMGGAGGQFEDYLGLFHNGSAGTVSHVYGVNIGLQNDNTAANSVAIFIAYGCQPMLGAGTQPEFGFCLNNSDPNQTITTSGHIDFNTSTAPTLSGAGTSPSLDATASDSAGTVTEGTTATGFTLTFFKPFLNGVAPHCVVSSPNGAAFTGYSTTYQALTLTNASASGNKYTYVCFGVS